jgi:hypothetical protein
MNNETIETIETIETVFIPINKLINNLTKIINNLNITQCVYECDDFTDNEDSDDE